MKVERLDVGLNTSTQGSCEQFVRYFQPLKQNERFLGSLWLWRQWRRYVVCLSWQTLIAAIVEDCDPYHPDEYERQKLFWHLRRIKPTPRLIRILYKAIVANPKSLVEWYETQGVSQKILGNIEQELLAMVVQQDHPVAAISHQNA